MDKDPSLIRRSGGRVVHIAQGKRAKAGSRASWRLPDSPKGDNQSHRIKITWQHGQNRSHPLLGQSSNACACMHANIQTSANECKEGGGGGGGYEESCRDVCVAAEQDTPSHWRLLTETRSECSFVSFCGGHAHQDHKYHPSCWTHPLSPIRLEAFLKSHQIYKHQISSFMTPKSPHICNGISNTRHREMTHAEAWQAVSVQSKHD